MKSLKILLALCLFTACKDKYDVPELHESTGILVVEGDLINNSDQTRILLTRTSSLQRRDTVPELKATVEILGGAAGALRFTEQGKGFYALSSLALDTTRFYRLHVKTSNGREYLTDSLRFSYNPPIDSVSFRKKDEGVWLYASTHDTRDLSRYFRYSFDETWEFLADFQTTYDNKLRERTFDSIYANRHCYRDAHSTDILLAATDQLTHSVLSEAPLTLILTGDIRLTIRYSILVTQRTLDKGAYDYWSVLRKNTEALGSIFDAQPTQPVSNIHCVTNPGEQVLGWISAYSGFRQQRIFITHAQVDPWIYVITCQRQVVDTKSILTGGFSGSSNFRVNDVFDPTSFYVTSGECADCRLTGYSAKPSFWP